MSGEGAFHVVSLTDREVSQLAEGSLYSSRDGMVLLVPESREADVREYLTARSLAEGVVIHYLSEEDLARLQGESERPAVFHLSEYRGVVCHRSLETEVVRALQSETGGLPVEVDE
jgi:hypothetical protein